MIITGILSSGLPCEVFRGKHYTLGNDQQRKEVFVPKIQCRTLTY